jgi:hypothetical protein
VKINRIASCRCDRLNKRSKHIEHVMEVLGGILKPRFP